MNDGNKPDGSAAERHLILVDGAGYIFRAFHAIPLHAFVRADGVHTNAVNGFCNMIYNLVEQAERDAAVDYVAVIFDHSRESFRNAIYDQYKANRDEPPPELVPQFQLIREATRAFNLPSVELAGYEADDLIATYARLAREQGIRVTVVSSDKDLMQLVRPGVEMYDPMKDRKIGLPEVMERFGVSPDKVVDVQALAGDSTDNVPGVPGIGVKTAAQLIAEYGDLDTLLARAGEIKQPKRRQSLIENADKALLSRELVRLKDDVPVEHGIDEFRLKRPEAETLLAFLREQEFRTITARFQQKFMEQGLSVPTPVEAPLAPVEQDYELVQDMAALKRWIAAAEEAGYVAIDTETTNLKPLWAKLVGISLALAPGKACYIPLAHRGGAAQGSLDLGGGGPAEEAPPQIPLDDAIAALKPLLEDPAVLKAGHNIKYDMTMLAQHGIRMAPIDDSMLMSYVLAGGAHGHGMDELARLHLGHDTIKFKDVAGTGKAQVTFDLVPLDQALDYAAEDADITLRLHRLLKPQLARDHMVSVYERIERPLVPVLMDMEMAGVLVDREELRRLSVDFGRRMDELEQECHRLAGRPFNLGSPRQLGEILFDEMSLGGAKKTSKSGAYATGADVLEMLAAQGHDLPARILDWRQIQKLKSTYADALVQEIHPRTGRVHTCFVMAVASTGRLSSTDPNVQNIPVRTEEGRKIRRAFVAQEGCRLVSLDYSQIELRLLAEVADVPALSEAFRAGVDIHALTASQVFGEPVEGMDLMTRRKAKAINFGIIYGISPFGLARQLGIAQGEAKAYIEAYFQRYPGIRAYMESQRALCRERGFVSTIFGRRIHVPGIAEKNPARRGFAERQAINAPLQGSAADIIKRAMLRVPAALEKAGLASRARMLLQVHDELLFEVEAAAVDDTIAAVRRTMEKAVHLAVPLVVEAGVGDTWADAH